MSRKITPLKCADNATETSNPTADFQTPNVSGPYLPIQPIQPIQCLPAPSSNPPAKTALMAPIDSISDSPPADRFIQIKIESLKVKQRADSFFNSLDPEQSYKLTKWMFETDNLSEVWRHVTAPAPNGLGINVNISTLRRLRDAWRAEDLSEGIHSMFDVVVDMEEQTDFNQTPRLQAVMNHLLHQTTFQLMRTQPASELLTELLAHIQKLTDLDLRRQKLQLERDKLLLKSTLPAPTHQTQHHRVDLNIVPPNSTPQREPIQINSLPAPTP